MDRVHRFLDTYGLPHRMPVFARLTVFMFVPAVVLIALWLLLPHTAAVVAILVVVLLAVVFVGLWRILGARELSEPPGRHPTPPPSSTPPETS
jgi:protein-S-isoprenylcysteine O-methyltransferase Ste14